MKQKVTKEKVKMAIESLKEIGEKPTIAKIRRITGGGNPLIMRFKNEIENEFSFIESSQTLTVNDSTQMTENKKHSTVSQRERILALEEQLHEIQQLLKMGSENKIKLLERELEKYKAEYVRQRQIVKIQSDVIRRLREKLKMINPQDGGENKVLH